MSLTLRTFFLFNAFLPIYASSGLLEANRGQFPSGVYFVAKNGGVSSAVTSSGIVFRGYHETISLRLDRALIGQCRPTSALGSEAHYLALSPPVSHVPQYSSIICPDIYHGIDWVVRTTNGFLEHDWDVAPGADARQIVLRLDGTVSARLTSGGDLQLRSGQLSVAWKAPQSYQVLAGVRRPVETRYVVRGRRITLQVGSYRRDLPLVIDPVIDFSYVVSGSGDDRGCQVALDGAGNIYLAGSTLSSGFETTPGAAFGSPVALPGNYHQVFVRKLSPDGSKLIYSTYLGLSSFYSAHPMGMRVDQSGNVYLATNVFTTTIAGGTPIDPAGVVGVYKLAPGGDRLIYETRVLSSFDYTEPVALAVDNSGNAYVGAGRTRVDVSKIDPEGKKQLYLYKAQVSGGLADLAVGSDGTLYLAGTGTGTGTTGGLVTTPGALKTSVVNPQNSHGFLIRLKTDGSGPIYSTFIGGDYIDFVSALAIDASGAAYVGGRSDGITQYPAIQGTPLGLSQPGSNRAFVMKVAPNGATAVFTSLLPGSTVDALTVDNAGNAYTAGNAYPAGLSAGSGLSVAKVNSTGNKLLYYSSIPATVIFPNTEGLSLGLAADSSGAAYLTGSVANTHVPDAAPSNRQLPNAFLLKIDPNPPQCDLSLTSPSIGTFLPGVVVSIVFTIHNAGPASADDVLFSGDVQGGQIAGCRASGAGACGTDPRFARVSFSSIPAGGNETLELQVGSFISPVNSVVVNATVSTVTSDVNQDNNTVAGTSVPDYVPINIRSTLSGSFDLGLAYTITGATPPIISGPSGRPLFPSYAAPNAQVQIYWPSPQTSSLGPVTFLRWQDGSTENPRTFTATPPELSVSANFGFLNTPYFTAASVGSAGSYAANGVSPGEFVAITGFNLGQIAGAQVQNGRVTTTLGNTKVSFDGNPAPLVYTSPSQINAIVPYEIAGESTTTIAVTAGSATFSVKVPVVQAVPALFTANASGTGQAAALNQDTSPNSTANPANPGDVIVLYGTGEGLLDPLPPDGTITLLPPPLPKLKVTVLIGGMPAEVLYAGSAPGLAAGVIQINARIPAGIKYSHHVPVAWKAGEFLSQSGVTIAINDSPGSGFVYQPGADDLTKSSITILPSRIATDSDATTVSVFGAGFVDGMVVRWNNQARPTQFVDSKRLQVTLAGDDLEQAQLGSIAVWDASQTNQVSQSVPLLVYLPLLNHDLIYDSTRARIYVAVGAEQRPQGSSIAVLNPETGRIERSYALEIEPTKLAISGDNHYLYVALKNTVRRINLDSWVADLDIPLGQTDFGSREVYTMVTLPGVNNSLAVSFFRTGLSPPYLGTAVFDDARIRPTVTPGHDGPSYLLGGPSAGTLYGADESGNFYILQLDSAGVKVVGTVTGLLGADGDSVYAAGLIYDGWGAVVDPSVPLIAKTFDNAGLIVPLPDLQKLMILGDVPPPGYSVFSLVPILSLHDYKSGLRLWSFPLPVKIGLNHGPMIRWGTNGIALRESQVYNAAAPSIDLFRLNLGQ